MMQQEFEAMVDSGKTVEELAVELAMGGDEAPMDAPDTDLSCYNSCSGPDKGNCGTCMQIRQNESDCALDTPGCARQVAYGGYVKSKVLIQCYATIDEGCQQLPTKYEAVQVSIQGKQQQGGPDKDQFGYTCKELCGMAGAKKGCDCNSEDTFLKVNNLFPKAGASTYG